MLTLVPAASAVDLDVGFLSRRVFTKDNGLPSNHIHALAQTPDGYLWVATQSGLVRFNGRDFKIFGPENEAAFTSRLCKALTVDSHGDLWIGTGLEVIHYAQGTFRRYVITNGTEGTIINCLHVDTKGVVWAGGGGGLGFGGIGGFKTAREEEGFLRTAVFDICELPSGELWLATGKDLRRRNPSTGRYAADVGQSRGVSAVEGDKSGRIWMIKDQQLFTRLHDQWLPAEAGWSVSHGEYPGIWRDRSENLCFPGENFRLVIQQRGNWRSIPIQPGNSEDIPTCFLEDREGLVWIGSSEGGLHQWRIDPVRLYSSADGLRHGEVRCVAPGTNGMVWVGGENGLGLIEQGKCAPLSDARGGALTGLRAIATHSDDFVWVGGRNYLYRIGSNGMVKVELPGPWFASKIRALHRSKEGDLWIGGSAGLKRLSMDVLTRLEIPNSSGAFTPPSEPLWEWRPDSRLAGHDVSSLMEDHQGVVWAGTRSGQIAKIMDNSIQSVTTLDGSNTSSICAMLELGSDVVLIATTHGLKVWQDGQLSDIQIDDVSSSDAVQILLLDKDERVWIAGETTLLNVAKADIMQAIREPSTPVPSRRLGIADGLTKVIFQGQVSAPSACQSSDGLLYFCADRGVVAVDPRSLRTPTPILPQVEEIRTAKGVVFGHVANPFPNQAKRQGAVVRVGSSEASWIRFSLTANWLRDFSLLQYRYRLVGMDKDWVEAGSRTETDYHGLRPGHYTIEVAARLPLQSWTIGLRPIRVEVLPAWFERPVVWFAGIVSLVCAAYGVHFWRVGVIGRIHAAERTAAVLQQQATMVREMHDRLAPEITALDLAAYRVKVSAEKESPIQQDLEAMASSAAAAKQILGRLMSAMPLKERTLEEFFHAFVPVATRLCSAGGISFSSKAPDVFPKFNMSCSWQEEVEPALKEAVNNAVKHSHATQITLECAAEGNELTLAVSDNGVGLDTRTLAGCSVGRGLNHIRERIRRSGGESILQSKPGEGTAWRFRFNFSD